jgi:hypothetical protein
VTSFHFDIDSRARQAGRFIGLVRRELLRALSQKKAEAGISQQALARKLDVHRSLINRQLSDLAWAMDMEISFELKKPETELGQNQLSTTSTVEHGQIKFINGGSNRNSFLAGLTSPQAVSTEMTKSA